MNSAPGSRAWERKRPCLRKPAVGGEVPSGSGSALGLAESHSQQDPTFRGTLWYTRLTAAEALQQLRAQGFPENDYRRPVRWRRF